MCTNILRRYIKNAVNLTAFSYLVVSQVLLLVCLSSFYILSSAPHSSEISLNYPNLHFVLLLFLIDVSSENFDIEKKYLYTNTKQKLANKNIFLSKPITLINDI